MERITYNRNVRIVQEHVTNLETIDGNFSQIGMWKLKNQLMPKEMDPPMAKFDDKGNLITNPNTIGKMITKKEGKRAARLEILKVRSNYDQYSLLPEFPNKAF